MPSAAYLAISGGIFHDCMVHDIDLMTYVLGEWPVEVFTSANAFSPEIHKLQDYDNVVSTFKFASGTDHTYICLLRILCMHSHGPLPWTVLFEKKKENLQN